MSHKVPHRHFDDDEAACAHAAGLRHVSDETAGYSRRRWGKGFTYRDWNGDTVRDERLRRRLASLAIPPAWEDVWICRRVNGHIQATGRDEAGRKQYVYHPRWQEARDELKFRRLSAFGRVLPRIRRRVHADLRGDSLSARRVLAAVVRLLDATLVRIGNDEYARENGSYGLTTLRKKHVTVDGAAGRVVLRFRAKSGKRCEIAHLASPALLRVIEECMATPGYELFKYIAKDGSKHDVKADDVNRYLRATADAGVRAKDFRMWGGTVRLAAALLDVPEHEDPDSGSRLTGALERVATALHNTVAVCREAYVHPRVIQGCADGDLVPFLRRAVREVPADRDLSREETAVLAYLEART